MRTLKATTSSELPLDLGGQAHVLPGAVGERVVVGHMNHWMSETVKDGRLAAFGLIPAGLDYTHHAHITRLYTVKLFECSVICLSCVVLFYLNEK